MNPKPKRSANPDLQILSLLGLLVLLTFVMVLLLRLVLFDPSVDRKNQRLPTNVTPGDYKDTINKSTRSGPSTFSPAGGAQRNPPDSESTSQILSLPNQHARTVWLALSKDDALGFSSSRNSKGALSSLR